jgi:diguanylate cyclase (GGDEF)-like protein
MGIRLKILLAFVVCFGLMAGISLYLLKRSMTESYDAIERRDLMAHMGRVQQAIEARLDALNTTAQDWSVWNDMYQFALKPNMAWAEENIGLTAMATADLSMFVVYDRDQSMLTLVTRDAQGGQLALPNFLNSPFATHFKQANLTPGCGLMPTDAGLMLSCWARIKRSDATGDFVGTAVLGRLLDASLLDKLRQQVNLPFELQPDAVLPPNLSQWPGNKNGGPLGSNNFYTAHEPSTYHLYYPLKNLLGQDAGLVKLDVPRDLHLHSEQLFERVRQEQLWIAAAMALLLFGLIQVLLIGRLRQFDRQLIALAKESTWDKRLTIGGTDEIGVLAGRVNQLLALIQSQVSALNEQSLTDPLTGLANRRAFDAKLAQEHARALRHGKDLALLMVDVDLFKAYNDFYGHPMGDLALKKIAEVLQQSIRQTPDLAARIGGEEFALLLPETDLEGARQTAQRIHANLRASGIAHAASSIAPFITLSLGLAVVKDETTDSFVQRADLVLYQAKESGRNCTECAM